MRIKIRVQTVLKIINFKSIKFLNKMKRLFKFMLLFSVLLITSVAVQAGSNEKTSPPECTVMVDQNFDIASTPVYFFENQYADQSADIDVLQTFLIPENATKHYSFSRNHFRINTNVRWVYINEKSNTNLLPLPFVRYVDKSNSINHYTKAANNNRFTTTTRHV